MIRIVIPSGGNSEFYKDSYYPKTLTEVEGKPMLQKVVENYDTVDNKRFVFIFQQDECNGFHTDNIALLMTNRHADIIRLKEQTGGALCSCLMAVDYINDDDEVIISNNDQIIDEDISKIINDFRKQEADCGVVCFESLHPRWTYIRIKDEDVVEAAEKRPVSKHAIAGLYYYRHGKDFIQAAEQAIKKGSMYNGKYYISSSINELILMNKKIRYYSIDGAQYHSFYAPDRIKIYEKECDNR